MASSLYRSLDPQKREIRILTILPCGDHVPAIPPTRSELANDVSSTNAAEIHCVLQTVSLEDEPSYTALSYNWGTDVPSTAVLINSKSIFVRRNLAAALRHLQQKDSSLNIWVDAICINQNDKKEKSSQVQMMAKIYEKSVGVLVWLGPVADESDAAMEKLRDIGEKAIDAGMQDFRTTDMPNWFNSDLEDRLQRLKTSLDGLAEREGLEIFHPALIPLSKRTYWTRIWVLQEFSIHKTAMIQCGSKILDVTTFGTALNFCAFARWTLSSRHKLEDYRDPKSKLRSVSGSANSPSGAPNQLFGARRRYYSETGERENLWSLLERTCMSDSAVLPLNATDPRDKIYGLLGLATDSEQLCILPDYEKSIIEVYTDISRKLITTGETSFLGVSNQHVLKDYQAGFQTSLQIYRQHMEQTAAIALCFLHQVTQSFLGFLYLFKMTLVQLVYQASRSASSLTLARFAPQNSASHGARRMQPGLSMKLKPSASNLQCPTGLNKLWMLA